MKPLRFPWPQPLRAIIVNEGDELWRIALNELGSATLWGAIAAINRLENPNLIHPGQLLVLPPA